MPSIFDIGNPSVLANPNPLGAVPSLKPEPKHRSVTDIDTTRTNIYDKVLGAVNNIGQLQNSRHTLALSDVDYIDPEHISLVDQKHAILSGKSLNRRLKGTWQLTDNATGNVLDKKTQTLAQVPYLTPRGTFVLHGTEYTLSSQARLRPGIFTRVKENGEIESHVNVMPGNGISHRYFLDPETGVFKINIGQAKMPLMPLLKALGVTDKELRTSWGDELVNANSQQADNKTINKLYQRLVRKPDINAPEETKAKALADLFTSMRLDPEVTSRTLGQPHDTLSRKAILDTTRKLIAVSRQEQEPDDRDNLAFQNFYGPEDILSERITRDRTFLRQMLWKASFKGNLASVHPGVLTRQIHYTIMHTGLGQAAEEINPAELLDAQTRTTRLGSGGIASPDVVPDESRSVQPSQFAFIDPIKTPESSRAGIDTRLASTVRKGDDGRLYAPFIDAKSGKTVYRSPQDVTETPIAFPGEMEKNKPLVEAMVNGVTKYIPREEVKYQLPHFENVFSPLSNMIPGKSSIKGQRMSMGARFLAQALPLVNNEAPFLQAGMPGQHMQKSFEDHYGTKLGAIRADQGGFVKKVTPDEITVQHDDGTKHTYETFNNFPYSRKTFLHNTSLVKSGQRFEKDDLLAKSNYTDDKGTTALGINARIAFIPFKGANFEDAMIISESMAKRLKSEHMYQHEQEWAGNIKKGLKPFISLFPTEYTKPQLANMDAHGAIKPGSEVKFGDPLVLVAEERDRTHSQIHRSRAPSFVNKTVTWDHHSPGIVTDTEHTNRGTVVAVKAYSEMQVGDKASNRFGGKGIIADILPDDQMPHDEAGKPFEVALNPLGMISRINPAQIYETVLGKIAKKTGIPYKLEDFASIKDLNQFVMDEAKKHNISDTETIIDPSTGRKIPNVLTGYQYLLKLHHTSESKSQGRGTGGYTHENIPARGGPEGSKKIGMLDTNALLSHGATEFLRDAHLVRGQRNDAYWQAFMSGFRPPEPTVPLIYNKFVDSLKASGINAVRDGRQLHIMALTDKDVTHLAGDRNLDNVDTVDWKEGLKPKPGGLFDISRTGGHGGNRFAAIKLHEPMPNPAFEEPVRRMLGLTQAKFESVLFGKESLDGFGSGPTAVHNALKNINIDSAISQAQQEVKGGKRTIRDDAVRKLQYLKNAKRLGLKPEDWILSRVPVLPPVYRPVSVMQGSGNQLISDANYLYKELFDANQGLKELSGQVEDVSNERKNLYNAFKGVVGLGEPIQPKNQERQVKGLLKHVFGTSPKFGVVQRQLLGATVDLVGRNVIGPDSNLDMDSVGIPESNAWNMYKPFIIRRLVQKGMPRLEAARAFKDQKPIARDALTTEMKNRPVVINRAPVLHRYGIMGMWPTLIKGNVMKLPMLIYKGLNADDDGDCLSVHVPVGEEAKQEVVDKMLPSHNLFTPDNFKVHQTPTQEYTQGLYHASTAKDDKRRPVIFRNKQDAIKAYREGKLNLNTHVEIVDHVQEKR